MPRLIFFCHSNYLPNGQVFDSFWPTTFEFFNHFFENSYEVVRHSLYADGQTRVYKNGVNGPFKTIPLLGKLPDGPRFLGEVIYNVFYLLFSGGRSSVIVAIDPLSCLVPTFLKLCGFRYTVFFITPDFARVRFKNRLLNRLYFVADKFCTRHSDKNLCCAKAVMSYKLQLYGEKISSKLVHAPNVAPPWLVDRYRTVQKKEGKIIYEGVISGHMDFPSIFQALAKVREKYPSLSLVLAGDGDAVDSLKKLAQDREWTFIQFLGKLEYADMLRQVADAEIGIALYKGNLFFDEFRDSAKIRDYQSTGTIPITTSVVKSNAEEIRQFRSGVIEDDNARIGAVVYKIFSDSSYKQSLRDNCLSNNELYNNRYEDFYQLINQALHG